MASSPPNHPASGRRLRPRLLVGDVIALEDTGRALAAMSKVSATAGMTVVRLAV